MAPTSLAVIVVMFDEQRNGQECVRSVCPDRTAAGGRLTRSAPAHGAPRGIEAHAWRTQCEPGRELDPGPRVAEDGGPR